MFAYSSGQWVIAKSTWLNTKGSGSRSGSSLSTSWKETLASGSPSSSRNKEDLYLTSQEGRHRTDSMEKEPMVGQGEVNPPEISWFTPPLAVSEVFAGRERTQEAEWNKIHIGYIIRSAGNTHDKIIKKKYSRHYLIKPKGQLILRVLLIQYRLMVYILEGSRWQRCNMNFLALIEVEKMFLRRGRWWTHGMFRFGKCL